MQGDSGGWWGDATLEYETVLDKEEWQVHGNSTKQKTHINTQRGER